MEMTLFNQGFYSNYRNSFPALPALPPRKVKISFYLRLVCIISSYVILIYANLRLIYRSKGKMYDVRYGQIQVVLDFATEEITKIVPFAQTHIL